MEEARFTTAALHWSACLSPRFRKPTRAYFHGWSMEYGVAIGLALDGARLTPASLVRRPSYWYWMMDRLTQRRRTAAAPAAAPSALSFVILGTVGCMRSQKQNPLPHRAFLCQLSLLQRRTAEPIPRVYQLINFFPQTQSASLDPLYRFGDAIVRLHLSLSRRLQI